MNLQVVPQTARRKDGRNPISMSRRNSLNVSNAREAASCKHWRLQNHCQTLEGMRLQTCSQSMCHSTYLSLSCWLLKMPVRPALEATVTCAIAQNTRCVHLLYMILSVHMHLSLCMCMGMHMGIVLCECSCTPN